MEDPSNANWNKIPQSKEDFIGELILLLSGHPIVVDEFESHYKNYFGRELTMETKNMLWREFFNLSHNRYYSNMISVFLKLPHVVLITKHRGQFVVRLNDDLDDETMLMRYARKPSTTFPTIDHFIVGNAENANAISISDQFRNEEYFPKDNRRYMNETENQNQGRQNPPDAYTHAQSPRQQSYLQYVFC